MSAQKFCKTKIIATIGPSSWDKQILTDMIEAGMDLARVNASFADYDELKRVKDTVRSISPRISMILDTMGNKIRVLGFDKAKNIKRNDLLILIPPTKEITQESEIQITYENLHKDISRGAKILVDDGNLELEVTDIKEDSVHCKALNEIMLTPRKTVNIPNQELSFPDLTPKDIQDIKYAVDLEYDFIALSFVQNSQVIKKARKIIGDKKINIISKIENIGGIKNFDEILDASDAIMLARGDLGVETPYEEIPIIQKQLIYRSRSAGKPIIVATQMLESMRKNSHPTRAEVSDVANTIIDGADTLMLSAETATGNFPVKSIETMNKIALKTEDVLSPQLVYGDTKAGKVTDEICKNVFDLTNSIDLRAVVVIADQNDIVNSLSRHRPVVPIFSINSDIAQMRKSNLLRGVKCYYNDKVFDDHDENVKRSVEIIFSYGELDFTDKIAIISGSTIKNKDNTLIEVSTVKDVIKN
jgi:pyruvate kinase